MEEIKKCPLMMLKKVDQFVPASWEECMEKNCSWWHKDEHKCAVISIAEHARAIYYDID